jgi:ATP-dependent DNA helicase RecG
MMFSRPINTLELYNLIALGEGNRLEYKSTFQKEATETLAAFANTHGGAALIGVSDHGRIKGIELGNESVQNWVNQCNISTTAHIIPDVDMLEIDDKLVVAISVEEYPIKPVASKKIRHGFKTLFL